MSSHRLGRFMAVNKMVDCTGPFGARKGRLRCRPYATPQADDADSTRPGSCRSGVRSPPQAAAAAQSFAEKLPNRTRPDAVPRGGRWGRAPFLRAVAASAPRPVAQPPRERQQTEGAVSR
jgi:hypothetical protein